MNTYDNIIFGFVDEIADRVTDHRGGLSEANARTAVDALIVSLSGHLLDVGTTYIQAMNRLQNHTRKAA